MPVVTRAMATAKRGCQQFTVDKGSDRKRPKVSEDEPNFLQSNHALFNHLVLESLFEYVRGHDLKACRLVCKKWHTVTLRFVRSRFQVTILQPSSQSKSVGNFVKLIESNTLGIPFARFELGSFDTTQGVGQRFLQLCGETVKEIILDGHYESIHVIEYISAILRSVPNLELLTMPRNINSKTFNDVNLFPGDIKPKLAFLKSVILPVPGYPVGTTNCPTFYEELFEVAENISTLDLPSFSSEMGSKVLKIVGKQLRKEGKPSIQNLILDNRTEEHMEILNGMARRDLKLKQLRLCYVYSKPDNIDWFQPVTLFKDSLTSLTVSTLCNIPAILIKFQRMPELKELELWMHSPTNLSLGSESFNNVFPILEKLRLTFHVRDNQYDFFTGEEDFTCPTMKSLILRNNPIQMETLNRILIRFPALTKFTCQITCEEGPDVMSTIWSQMTQLEVLDISGGVASSENLDSLFTGIPVQEIQRMDLKGFSGSLQKESVEVRRERILLEINKHDQLPSIRNLTNLRSLKVDLRTIGDVYYLTDVTGYLGLYSLKNLRHLDICQSKISNECVDVLALDLYTSTFIRFDEYVGGYNSFTIESN